MDRHVQRMLVVGLGLAGAVIARTFRERGWDVTVVEGDRDAAATPVAAGMVNPVIGTKRRIPRGFKDAWSVSQNFYRGDKATYWHHREIILAFADDDDRDAVSRRFHDGEFSPWALAIEEKDHFAPHPADSFGSLRLRGAWVDVRQFVGDVRAQLDSEGRLIVDRFLHSDLIVGPPSRWRDEIFDAVVFCEGWRVRENPWFKDDGWKISRGEILEVDATGLDSERILHAQKNWLMPRSDQRATLGARNSWHNVDAPTDDTGRQELEEALGQLAPNAATHAHRRGVRCAGEDWYPLVTTHSDHESLHVFNGFGTRGALFAPIAAQKLLDQLCGDPS